MKLLQTAVTGLCAASLLTGLTACVRQDAASYLYADDNRHSLSLLRETWPWSDTWTVKLVTANGEVCQRRHELRPVPTSSFRIAVYQPAETAYILQQGSNWYVTGLAECGLQRFEEPPPYPGTLLGYFVERDEKLTFQAETPDNAAADSAASTSGSTPDTTTP